MIDIVKLVIEINESNDRLSIESHSQAKLALMIMMRSIRRAMTDEEKKVLDRHVKNITV